MHAHDVVHRNLSPETIQIGFDRKPRLTDFDRAYIEGKYTVYAASTTTRHINLAYIPPELADATDYDFDTTSDMYSFGVLLYQLLADEVPFPDAPTARGRQGKPATLPSAKREGVDPQLEQLILDLLRVDDFKARPPASRALAILRDVLGVTSAAERGLTPPPPSKSQESFEPGSLLRGTMRVDVVLGTGGFSKVLKVFHLDHQKYYALKILFDTANADLLMHEFNRVRPLLPRAHPGIAEIEWMERLDPPDRLPCLLTEFIDGETLEAYCDGRKRLPWTDIKRIGLELLDALIAIHPDEGEYQRLKARPTPRPSTKISTTALMSAKERAQRGLFHRDLKPANVMLAMPSHRAVLIDFNIASSALTRRRWGGLRSTAHRIG